MAKRWYVVHAYSGFEKKVMNALRERIALSGMADLFGEVLTSCPAAGRNRQIGAQSSR